MNTIIRITLLLSLAFTLAQIQLRDLKWCLPKTTSAARNPSLSGYE